jgi:hypothetical protein
MIPEKISSGANGSILNEIKNAVNVEPTLAPMMNPTNWLSLISPALINPIAMTEVAVELCMTAVTSMPTRSPRNLLVVAFPIIARNRLPAMFFKPSDIIFRPNRNSPNPPKARNIC